MTDRPLAVIVLAVCGFMATLQSTGAHAEEQKCALKRLAELPMIKNDAGMPVVSIQVDGAKRSAILDISAPLSLIDSAITHDDKVRVNGVGIASTLNKSVRIRSIKFGGLKAEAVDFIQAPPGGLGGYDISLGTDWLSLFDVEIDPAGGKVSLFSPDHCKGQVIHWAHTDQSIIPFSFYLPGYINASPDKGTVIPLLLNGERVEARVNTGSKESVIDIRLAHRLFGVTADSPGIQPHGFFKDQYGVSSQMYLYRFQSLQLGDIVFKNTPILLANMSDSGVPSMILGMHQLRGVHLYVAFNERALYATSVAGDIAAVKSTTANSASSSGGFTPR